MLKPVKLVSLTGEEWIVVELLRIGRLEREGSGVLFVEGGFSFGVLVDRLTCFEDSGEYCEVCDPVTSEELALSVG